MNSPNLSDNRRGFLVKFAGTFLGQFFLPGFSTITPQAAEDTPDEVGPSGLPARFVLLVQPVWLDRELGKPPAMMLHLVEHGIYVMSAESTDRSCQTFQEMLRLYESCLAPFSIEKKSEDVFPIHRTPEELALFRAIVSRPEDTDPYLKYARLLKSQGKRVGDYIEADIFTDLNSSDHPDFDRMEAIYDKHVEGSIEEISEPLSTLGLWSMIGTDWYPQLWMKWGVIDKVEVKRREILPEKVDWLFQAAPALTKLHLQFEFWDIPTIVSLPQMCQIMELAFRSGLDTFVEPDDVEAIARSKMLPRLSRLDLSSGHLGASLESLVTSPILPRLESLNVLGSELEEESVKALLASRRTGNLQELQMSANSLSADVLHVFAKGDWSQLQSFFYASSDVDGTGLAILLQTDMPKLRQLDLGHTRLDADSGRQLAKWSGLQQLERLDVGGNDLGDEGVIPIVSSSRLSRLKELDIGYTQCTAATIDAIVQNQDLAELEKLDLGEIPLTAREARKLANAGHLHGLQRLSVSNCDEETETILNEAFDNVYF
ncbi:leucine-rich repeat domain-containing protein [Bremerella sp. T1]|uniref:hypothetical protein n=1 Tax=Bremerella sp. TYQ1 TaxID=3119568 RepID=UPI001CCA8020|nr:hypothetical protein [Bremerella volcania]UBM37564.1 hypothetical protein LA756_06655 [Bremerella volcania]